MDINELETKAEIRPGLFCGDCGAPMGLKVSSKFGYYYGCTRFPKCQGLHSAHQTTLEPMGKPADKETRELRKKAHDVFDRVWKDGKMSRRSAYYLMRRAMGISAEDAHISLFDKEQCKKLISLCKGGLKNAIKQNGKHYSYKDRKRYLWEQKRKYEGNYADRYTDEDAE